jgi:hypothetical protein
LRHGEADYRGINKALQCYGYLSATLRHAPNLEGTAKDTTKDVGETKAAEKAGNISEAEIYT